MCSNAINKALKKIDFVQEIQTDIKKNIFTITMKDGAIPDFDIISQKVEDAGFFVAELKVYYNTYSAYRYSAPLLFLENAVLFIDNFNEKKETQIYKFIDEGFLTSKELKKYRKIKTSL